MTPLHPLSNFLQHWFADGEPTLARLNEAARQRGVMSGGDVPLRFVPPVADAAHYEARIFSSGAVATRDANAHDLFNALIWLTFPQTKAVINRLHFLTMRDPGSAGCGPLRGSLRGPLRDALTQFDECGVIVTGTSPALWEAICAHRWQEAFVIRRDELKRTTRFIVFGHASHEALMSPFNGLCGKSLFLPLNTDCLTAIDAKGPTLLDESLARRLARVSAVCPCGNFWLHAPRDLQPLPLLGIPGATAENEAAAYYADTRQFRPARTMRAGSSPGSRWMPTKMRYLEESPGPVEQDAG